MAFGPAEWIKLVLPSSRGGLDDREALEILQDQLEELAFAYEGTDPQGRLSKSEYPGYLSTTFGDTRVFVPWPLVRSFPSSDHLEEFVRLAATHCLCGRKATCLSGSSAGSGSEIEIGDIDFCQYTELLPPEIYDRIENGLHRDSADRKPIVVRYGSYTQVEAPHFERLPQLKACMTNDATLDLAERCLLDYVVDTKPWGLVPLSNVVLPCDFADRIRGAATRSFVFQETVLTDRDGPDGPAWSLVSVGQLGGYLQFLIEQINEYKREKPLKALKRALALAHTIQLFSFVDEISTLLLSDEAKVYIRRSRVIDCEILSAMRDDLKLAPADRPILDPDFRSRCETVADRILLKIWESRS